MKRVLALLAAVSSLGVVLANPVGAERAAAVAYSFWQHTLHGKADITLENRTGEWRFDGIYLFTASDGGFVMVAADDAARPILGYSLTSPLEPDQLPVQLDGWLETYQQQIDWIRENEGQPYAYVAEEWHTLEQGKPLAGSKSDVVGPLLTTQWDQTWPYNMYYPTGTVTGCAATAQAQMMKYWNHPVFGNGSNRYTHAFFGSLSADFAHTLYRWDAMPDAPTNSTNGEAVGVLMYHCGVSLNMGYGTAEQGGSAAPGLTGIEGTSSIDNSLKGYFHYSPDMTVIMRDYGYTNAAWRNALIAELNLLHPIIYTGSATQGGHGFVCDGYDNREYLHFNFGWSGRGDGFFPVDSISPGVGGAGGNVTYTFNLMNQALLGAVPDYAMRVSDSLICLDGDGGRDSLLFCTNPTTDAPCSLESNADWITVDNADSLTTGWIYLNVSPYNGEGERSATLTFRQGDQTVTVNIVQNNYGESDLCPVKVVMHNLRSDDGWQGGAHLTLESANGFIYGTAELLQGATDSVEIDVAPHDLYIMWHSGGGFDRYMGYRIVNQHGETLVEVERAYYDEGQHFVEWPCAHLGVEQAEEVSLSVSPNPASGMVTISGVENGAQVALIDISGHVVRAHHAMPATRDLSIDLSNLSKGTYFLRITGNQQSVVRKLIVQ